MLLARGLILNLHLHIVDGVRQLNIQSDGFSSEGLDEDLHSSTKMEDEVESRLLQDYNQKECDHLRAAIQRRLGIADQPSLSWILALALSMV